MRGIVAKRLRKKAAKLCNKEAGNYIVKQFKKLFFKEEKEVEKINETISWSPDSYMAIYRQLKKNYREGKWQRR